MPVWVFIFFSSHSSLLRALSTFWETVSMAFCLSHALSLSGGAKTTDRTLMGVQLVKLGWCPRRTAYLQTPEDFSGQVPSHLVIRFGARQFRCGPRWQKSIVDWPYQSFQCFAVRLTPGNVFQHLLTAWWGNARGWWGAAVSHTTVLALSCTGALLPSLVHNRGQRVHHGLDPSSHGKYRKILPWSTVVPWGSVLSNHTVHACNRLPHMKVGAMKSHMFSLIHHLKQDSFDAVIMCIKARTWKTAKNTSEVIVLSCSGRLSNSFRPFIPLRGILGFFHDVIITSHHFLVRLLPFLTSYPISSFPA